jgi:hypothetical protein
MTAALESADQTAGGEPSGQKSVARIERPFGQANRSRLIGEFLSQNAASNAWQDVYRLLLWADQKTGLAHCYESDKSQPGKPWYPRSLRFHEWVSGHLNTTPAALGEQIDWLFRRTADDFAREMVGRYQAMLKAALTQRKPFEGRDFPEPGDDPGIVEVIRDVLGARLSEEPSPEEWRTLTRRIRELIAAENKRKNLVGEGFEDVVSHVLQRFDTASRIIVEPRKLLSAIPGFSNVKRGGKALKVDLAITRKEDRALTFVTAKWSIRADRERQFASDHGDYVNANSGNEPFSYVLVTNEFDPARLQRACDLLSGSNRMFNAIVHIAPQAIAATYGNDKLRDRSKKVLEYIDKGRIVSLDQWIAEVVGDK